MPRHDKSKKFVASNAMNERGPNGEGIGALDMVNIKPSLTFDASAPNALLHLFYPSYHQHLEAGLGDDEAKHRALREANRAGWMKTKRGWEQVLPDLRDKVRVVEGIKQPDGRYFLEGVPVFHPNNAKGIPFTIEKIRQIIKNTNAAIGVGGSRPVLIEGHPNELQDAMGKQLDSHGFCVNFREEDPEGKPGYASCDMIDVEPEYYQRMRDKKLPGVSAGFRKDDLNMNRCFGHVALLGGTSPGLTHLPATEYFSASGNYVCFSAEPEIFPERKKPMLTQKQKDCFAAMSSAKEAYDAAEMAQGMQDPTAEGKMAESYAAMCAAKKKFDAAMGEGGGPMGNVVQDEEAPPTIGNGAAAGEYGNVSNGDMPNPSTVSPPSEEYSALVEEFDAKLQDETRPKIVQETFAAMTMEIRDARKTIAQLQQASRIAEVRKMSEHFSAKLSEFRKSGRLGLPNPKNEKEEFASFADHKDPRKAMQASLARYERIPAGRTPATINNREPIFSASGDNGSNRLAGVQPVRQATPPAKITMTPSLTNQGDLTGEAFAAAAEIVFSASE